MTTVQTHVSDHDGMVAFGQTFANQLQRGDVVLLHGDLGAGKTTLTQGIVKGLGVGGVVQSPTFSLVSEHDGVDSEGSRLRVYHLDLYRLEHVDELEGIGYEDYIAPMDGISIIEWPERAGDWLPPRFLFLSISFADLGGRLIEYSWHGVDTED